MLQSVQSKFINIANIAKAMDLMNQTHIINDITFEWDSNKALLISKTHGVTFQECATILFNPTTITKQDYRDYGERRFISTGSSDKARILTVVWTERYDKIRLITGFLASKDQIKEFYYG